MSLTTPSPRERWLLENAVGRTILDVGFAGQKSTVPGYFPRLAAQHRDVRLIGVDWNQQAVVSRHMPRSVVADAAALPVRAASVDCVIMGEFLEHHVAIETFMIEAARVLKPAGVLLITTPNPLFLNRLIRSWFAPRNHELTTRQNLERAMGYHDHQVLWDPLSLAHIVCRSGLIVDEVRALGTWIPGLGRLIPRFRRSLLLNFWPANRLGYITCLKGRKPSTGG